MTIVEKAALSNGAHRNQTISGILNNIPEGWAAIPEELESKALSCLPFIALTLSEDGTVTDVAAVPASENE